MMIKMFVDVTIKDPLTVLLILILKSTESSCPVASFFCWLSLRHLYFIVSGVIEA